RKGGQVVTVVVHDLADAVAHVAGDSFAFAQYFAGDGIERVVVHADEGAAQQIDAVQHQPAGNRSLPAAKVAFGLAQAHRRGVAAELQRMSQAEGDLLQHGEIEVDRVPA